MPYIPLELLEKIALNIKEPRDLSSFRLASKRFAESGLRALYIHIAARTHIYLREENMAAYLNMLELRPALAKSITKVHLVGEVVRQHRISMKWAFEQALSHIDEVYSQRDDDILAALKVFHMVEASKANTFICNGGVARELGKILKALPNLELIFILKLKPDDHIPGLSYTNLIQQLSINRPRLFPNNDFYDGYKYDSSQNRTTHYWDIFGDLKLLPGAGPQAVMADDIVSALQSSGTKALVALSDKWHRENIVGLSQATADALDRVILYWPLPPYLTS